VKNLRVFSLRGRFQNLFDRRAACQLGWPCWLVAQLITYLRLTGLSVGLIINFNVTTLRDGIRRVVNTPASESRQS